MRANQLVNDVGFVATDKLATGAWSASGDPAALAREFAVATARIDLSARDRQLANQARARAWMWDCDAQAEAAAALVSPP